ncbi:MAG: O-acetylhomoserine aminocarboxypropyltransferase [Rhodospirillaceae bacterium]|nr:O-acetylhomoserine aminocarboxypropyltransferase [Rhodospirillaceae bacterium]
MTTQSQNPETIGLHGGSFRADPTSNAVAVPIYQTTSYQFNDADHAANLFGLAELGNIYTRIMNPTAAVLEERLAQLEGAVAGLAVASGQAAISTAILTIAEAGDNIVASTDLYGGTVNLFSNSLRQIGIEVRWADPADPENFHKLSDDRTRAFFGETLPNPKLQVFPIGEVAQIGEELGIPLIVDNTAAPIICKLIKHGAHIVIHSTTKYIGGQGTSIGGVILDSGRFDWEGNAARFPLLNQPDASYHGAVWVEAVKPLGPIAFILKARVTVQRDYGFALSPQNAFQFIPGLETLALRFERQNENAAKVADYLGSHPDVVRVIYATAKEGTALERAGKYLDGGAGALVGFEHKGGLEAGKAFINALGMLYHVANIGDNRSLAIHPASTTHSQLPPEQQAAAGVTPGYVRLSIGIEHADDIIADIDQALNAATSSLAVAA